MNGDARILLPIMHFEKIWIEQCRATRAIKRRFGVKDALDYLVGELRMFAGAARRAAAFARELPRFLCVANCKFLNISCGVAIL
jgi:hypothetical protein